MPTCQCASRCDVVQLKHAGWPYVPVTIFGSTHTISDVLLTPVPQGRGKRELAIGLHCLTNQTETKTSTNHIAL